MLPIIGKDAFGPMAGFLKMSHNYVAFAFMLGLAIAFVLWIVHNIPNRYDVVWLLKGGGLLTKGVHPPAKKFNAGQKIVFWLGDDRRPLAVDLGLGAALPLRARLLRRHLCPAGENRHRRAGAARPARAALFGDPGTAVQHHLACRAWLCFMVCVIFGHIYIGTIGMEGAYDAMGSGDVDLNWAKEHHSLWVEEVQEGGSRERPSASPQPAE